MSLGLRGGSQLHGLLGLFADYSAGKVKSLVQLARAYAAEQGIEAAFRSIGAQQHWQFSFHPAAEDIEVTVKGEFIAMDARTAAAGPGYHAFVVGFIDFLRKKHGWVWEFAKATRGFGDDTGYYHDRNFAALQAAMADALAALSRRLLEPGEGDSGPPYYVALPLEFNMAGRYFAATSLGFRDVDFFEQPEPEQFFPWWEEGLTAQTLRNLALCKMWLNVTWTPPADEDDWLDLTNCRQLIDHALAAGAEFTENEGVAEIDALLQNMLANLDDTECIGYRRQPMQYLGTGGWTVNLPACYQEHLTTDTTDTELISLTYGDRAIHMRSYTFETALTQPQWPEVETAGDTEYLRFETDRYRAIIMAGEQVEDGRRFWMWQGTYQALDGWAQVTVVSYQDDATWAERVLRSVQPELDADAMVTPVEL